MNYKIDLNKWKQYKYGEDQYIEPNPCGEEGYVAYGTKIVDGKEVPNCIPDPEQMKKPKVNLAEYPWDQCIADQMERYGDEEIANKVCGMIKATYVKEGFVIPEPEGGEDEQAYVSRCIAAIYDEYGQEQSAAICYSKWREGK